jgi:hypothetical protein
MGAKISGVWAGLPACGLGFRRVGLGGVAPYFWFSEANGRYLIWRSAARRVL